MLIIKFRLLYLAQGVGPVMCVVLDMYGACNIVQSGLPGLCVDAKLHDGEYFLKILVNLSIRHDF